MRPQLINFYPWKGLLSGSNISIIRILVRSSLHSKWNRSERITSTSSHFWLCFVTSTYWKTHHDMIAICREWRQLSSKSPMRGFWILWYGASFLFFLNWPYKTINSMEQMRIFKTDFHRYFKDWLSKQILILKL